MVDSDTQRDLLHLTSLFEEVHFYRKKGFRIFCPTQKIRNFDYIFLPRVQLSKATFLYSFFKTKKLVCGINKAFLKLLPSVKLRPPSEDVHEIYNHYRLWFDETWKLPWENQFDLKFPSKIIRNVICIHPFAEYNKAKHKNLSPHVWNYLIKNLSDNFPDKTFRIVGLQEELSFLENFEHSTNVSKMTFEKNLTGWIETLIHSDAIICPDTAALHIGAMNGIPTFSIWGGSNPALYGYSRLDDKHYQFSMNPACGPCDSYIGKNISKVDKPDNCPDYLCIRTMDKDKLLSVMMEFIKYLKR
ncbi:MAG: hypothetical protein IPM42_10445 [Saprospiraceae bacterium]|nr:hypothetical protein [Saprospiraceae bacterium]